jgi:hypothetical protein
MAAKTAPQDVDAYLAGLPEDRRVALSRLRDEINRHLPDGYTEGIQYGMISWFVPHSRYPGGYHCDPKQPVPFVGLGSPKSHVAVYAFCAYMDPELKAWVADEIVSAGKKLDMGKGCIRFKKVDQIPAGVFGPMVAKVPVDEFLATYEANMPASARKKRGLA